jgi:3-hydroxybutyryl-CoA dehydrogenase
MSVVSQDCILATNTSSLSITSIASVCNKPERIIGIHFFNPAHIMPLVEIIKGLLTSDTTINFSTELISELHKDFVIAKDTPGFIVNRVARPFYGEALRILEEGIADIPTIDWAMKETGKFRMGPFELMVLIGIDVNYSVTQSVFENLYFDPRYKPSIIQKRYVDAKMYGKKTGRGFYDYSGSAANPAPNKDLKLAENIFNRIIAMLINEACEAVLFNIASANEIDMAMVKGVNYPKGLLKWADELGLSNVLNILNDLFQEYNEDRYRPSSLLKKMVKDGKRFYLNAD